MGAKPPKVLRCVPPSPLWNASPATHNSRIGEIGEEETRTKRSPQTKTIEQNQSLDPKQQKNKKNKKNAGRSLSSSFLLLFSESLFLTRSVQERAGHVQRQSTWLHGFLIPPENTLSQSNGPGRLQLQDLALPS